MPSPQSLPWAEPLELAAAIDDPYVVLLYSGVQTSYSGRYSYLACRLRERIEAEDFSAFESRLTTDRARFDNMWFGYLAYGLKDGLERLAEDKPGPFHRPRLCMMRFAHVYQFDHEKRCITLWSEGDAPALSATRDIKPLPAVESLTSNMTRDSYLAKVKHILKLIADGDLYQANLTRKFFGRFASRPDDFSLFRKLCEVSPAPYSAFLRLGDMSVLSSSPEMFLTIDNEGQVRTRPIKGTAPRHPDPARDKESFDKLAACSKNRAENLMIVDLMRNDLSRSCLPGSVKADGLFEVTSHAVVHHMSGTVSGRQRADCTALDTVKASFPPGSMTGAPKIRAMNLCTHLEELERGIYSGAIGWFGGDNSCELSVVIRTLVLKGQEFEFQVGGGIVADSSPEAELKEIIDKAKGILACLNLSADKMAA